MKKNINNIPFLLDKQHQWKDRIKCMKIKCTDIANSINVKPVTLRGWVNCSHSPSLKHFEAVERYLDDKKSALINDYQNKIKALSKF